MELALREQIMINQFVMAVGSTREQARQLLQSSSWQFEIALSTFFQEAVPRHTNTHFNMQMCAPANTPATPPAFPEALAAFARMSAQDKGPASPVEGMSPPPQPSVTQSFQSHCQPGGLQSHQSVQQPTQVKINSPFSIPAPSQPREICSNIFQINNNR